MDDLMDRASGGSVGLKVAGALAALLVFLVCAGLTGGATSSGSSPVECQVSAGSSAIPSNYFPWLTEAATKYHLGPRGPSIVAAIHYVESNWDRSPLPGVAPGTQNSMGAEGPGQFLVPSWEAYGVDADGDGVKDPYSIPDSVFATARLLHADGAPKDWRDAIWDYNHAWWYVDEVLEKASQLKLGTVCEGSTLSIAGATQTVERMKSAASWIESRRLHYCWGGGHGPEPGPSSGTYCWNISGQQIFGASEAGLDCSGAVRWLLVLSGFPDPGPIGSGEFRAHYPHGPGRLVTIWSNFDHVFIDIGGQTWGTSESNFAHGPGYAPHSTEAFLASHPPGL